MEKEIQCDDLELEELLCVRVFSNTFHVIGLDRYYKAITEWAERKVLTGEESDTLLILASLNLEPIPDRNEVEQYLKIYQREMNIQNPHPHYSALVWLRMQIGYLIASKSGEDVEGKLALFTHYFLDFPPRAFARSANILSNFYWELFDEAIPIFYSKASEMSENELILHVKERLTLLYRKLDNSDWMGILAREIFV